MGNLTVHKVRKITRPGLHGDGNTLFLCVKATGAKSWIQRLTVHGKRRDIGLGSMSLVSLAEAREAAFENRRIARRGGDPLQSRRQAARVPTFREAIEQVIAAHRNEWKGERTAGYWRRSMDQHVYPIIGSMRLNAIGQADVLRALSPIWTAKPETGRKVRRRIRAALAWGQAHGYVSTLNPAAELIDAALPKQPAVKAHLRAMPYAEVGEALETIEGSPASIAAKACLRLVILTAVRNGEARLARWSEIDMARRTWTIPADRMKAGKEHRVPLSEATVEALESARILEDGSGLVFPSPVRRGRPLSDMTLTKVLRDTGLADRATVHGFRSSFRDWCAETGKPREIAEAALAHVVGGVEGAYFRSDLFDRRRVLMQSWADYLSGTEAKVVSLRA